MALGDRAAHGLMDRPEGRAPADHGDLGALTAAADVLVWNAFGDAEHLGGAGVGHFLVHFRAIVDVAGAGLLLDAADAMLESGRSGLDPGTRAVAVASVRHELFALGGRRGGGAGRGGGGPGRGGRAPRRG